MTQEQIDVALLTQSDVPAGWTIDTTASGGASDASDDAEQQPGSTFDPPQCADVVDGIAQDGAEEREPVAHGAVTFDGDGTFFSETIETWDSTVRESELEDLVSALSLCPSYTQTDAEGNMTTTTITALDVPNYGDRTFAVRVAATSGGDLSFTLTMDVVLVASGNMSVSLIAGGVQPVEPAALQELAAAAMEKVDDAV